MGKYIYVIIFLDFSSLNQLSSEAIYRQAISVRQKWRSFNNTEKGRQL